MAAWIRLDTDARLAGWTRKLTAAEFGAFCAMLLTIKAFGKRGSISIPDLHDHMEASGICSELVNGVLLKWPTDKATQEGGVLSVTNWTKYQSDVTSAERQAVYREKQNEPAKDEKVGYSEDFERFFKAYPRKIGKGAAWKAWNNAKARPDTTLLIESVKAHELSRQWQKDGGQFIPHPATWLNQRRWEDSVDMEEPNVEF